MAQDLESLIGQLPEHERKDARELSENILFMRRKLRETRLGLEGASVVVPYDNGGGQTGIRKNPAFAEYRDLLKSYQSALMCLRQMLGLDQPKAKPEEQSVSALEQMRDKYGGKYKVLAGGG